MKRLGARSRQRRKVAQQRSAEIKRLLTGLVDEVMYGRIRLPSVADRMQELEAEQAQLAAELEAIAAAERDQVVELHPAAIDAYRKAVDKLQAALAADPQAREEAGGVLRPMIEKVLISPLPDRGRVQLMLH